ncbi:MAG: hypothetical protein R2733_25725 [Acidimicrobiales bacterium]
MTTVRAPGSSANLGPGFDVLGAAIDRHAWVSDAGPLTGLANQTDSACGDDHLVTIAHRAAGGSGPVWFAFDLRPGRGMGFSGAARAAAAVLAGVQARRPIDEARRRAYEVVSELEGHGDNAAPSVFGGIHIVGDDTHHRIDGSFPGRLLLWVPDTESSTDASRSGLPSEVARADAVFNIGQTALLVAALYERDAALFARAVDDRLHQAQRLAGLPGSANAIATAQSAGALATWLSGSGPSVGVLCDEARVEAVTDALSGSGAVEAVSVDLDGAVVVP